MLHKGKLRQEASLLVLCTVLMPLHPASAQEVVAASPVENDIVVTGFRSSLASALNEKRAQAATIDTIKAEDIGKFPDSNLAESMQRLPGIALSRGDGGEGRNITVRGLAAEFTRVRINGMEGTSQSGASDIYGGGNAGRSFDFNVFPSEIFTSLSVRKTPSADVEEGSLGATVELAAPHPLDYHRDFVLTATGRGIYNTISRDVDPRLSALVSKTFLNGTLGVLASASYSRRNTRDVGYGAVLVLPPQVNGGFCTPIGVSPQNPANSVLKGTDALNCSTNNPRTGSVDAYNMIQARLGPKGQPGGGAFFPRIPRYTTTIQSYERTGGSLSLQWAPKEGTEIVLDGLYSRFDVSRNDSHLGGLSFARSLSNNGQARVSSIDLAIHGELSQIPHDDPSPERVAISRSEWQRVLDAISLLPDRCRAVILMRRVDGLPQRQVARTLGLAEHTVENDVVKGVRAICRSIADAGCAGRSRLPSELVRARERPLNRSSKRAIDGAGSWRQRGRESLLRSYRIGSRVSAHPTPLAAIQSQAAAQSARIGRPCEHFGPGARWDVRTIGVASQGRGGVDEEPSGAAHE